MPVRLAIGLVISSAFVACAVPTNTRAEEPITRTNVKAPPPIAPDEPVAREFSLERAARYLDTAALSWLKTKNCAACHTMVPYMMARPALAPVLAAAPDVRRFFEDITATPENAFPSNLPADGRTSVVVGIATGLAFNDHMTTGKLHPRTRKALDRMWAAQRPDGGWDWPFRDVPPIKMTEHYGVTFAALGVGLAPEGYAKTEPARQGLAGIRKYLEAHSPTTLHERIMLLWVSRYIDGVLTQKEQTKTVKDLLAAQRPDGGWSMASLLENPEDAKRQTDQGRQARAEKGHGAEFLAFVGRDHLYKMPLTSDGYATGFATYVARQAGVASDDKRLRQGIAWLKSHQRVSGRWFTPSLGFHKEHLISNAGTAYAVLALHACGEVPLPKPASRTER
jgi:squalene-hopene/tetraprenyl-beta-curcumene cyclase